MRTVTYTVSEGGIVQRVGRIRFIMSRSSLAFFFFSSRRRHTRCSRDWSSDVCSSDLSVAIVSGPGAQDALVMIQGSPLKSSVRAEVLDPTSAMKGFRLGKYDLVIESDRKSVV